MTVRTITILLAAVASATCSERAPTAPDETRGPPAMGVTGGSAADGRAATAAAVDDSRQRIIPEFRADPALGALQATKDLAAGLDELAVALAQPGSSLDRAIRRATQAITTLEDAVKGDGGRAADLTVVRLAVEQARDLGRT